MEAMVITDFGGTDVFEQRDVEKPSPRAVAVLGRLHASLLNSVG